jgi:RNA polymerase sigma-70 factor (ECF subfamily)
MPVSDFDDDANVSSPGPTSESTQVLLAQARNGDDYALDRLFARYVSPLRRWASGRLPRGARDIADTQDLVQETLICALRRLDSFEPRHEGALFAYLRQALLNRIRDEYRRSRRRPESSPLSPHHADDDASPLERAIGTQTLECYEQALDRLRPAEREAIIARVELQLSYEEIAIALDKPSRDAARMAVARALLKLALEMAEDERRI